MSFMHNLLYYTQRLEWAGTFFCLVVFAVLQHQASAA